MREFFVGQMDFIFLVYGLSLVLLAVAAYFISRVRPSQGFWKWIALFGLVLGLTEWAELFSLNLEVEVQDFLRIVPIVLRGAAFLCFVEIVRRDAANRRNKVSGVWIYAPLLVFILAVGWLLGGLTGISILSRYVFVFIGGLLAARVIAGSAAGPDKKTRDRKLFVFAWMLGIYAALQSIVPAGTFLPASVVNQDSFFSLLGFPVQLLRTLLVIILAVLTWEEYFKDRWTQNLLRVKAKIPRGAKLWFPAGLAIILLTGGFTTGVIGLTKDREEREDLMNQIRVTVAMIDPSRIQALSGTPADLRNDDYKRLQAQFLNILEDRSEMLYIYLFGQKDGQHIFLLDSEWPGRTSSSEPMATPGDVYEEDQELLERMFSSGGEVTVGPERDKWGTFISGLAAVRDPADGRVIAVLGIDYDARDWARGIDLQRMGPIWVTLLFCLLFSAFFILLNREQEVRQDAQAGESLLKELLFQLDYERKNLELIFDSTQAGLLLVDSRLKVRRVNQVVLNMMGGQGPFDVVGHQPGDVLSCVQAQEGGGCGGTPECKVCPVRATANRIVQTGESVRDEEVSLKIRQASGEHKLVWLEVNASPLEIEGERHVLFSLADITDRKKAEKLLIESENKYRDIIDLTETGYLIVDSQGRVQDANQEYVRLSGHISLREILGKIVFDWTEVQAKPRSVEALAQCLKMGLIRDFYTEYVDGNGKMTPVEINASVEGTGDALRIIALCRDISERKGREEKEKKQSRQLEVFYKASLGREERIVELKKELANLKKELKKND